MRKSRFGEEQIIKILNEAEAGRKIKDLCRDQPGDYLPLASQVRRAGRLGGEAPEGAGVRESPAEEAGGGSQPRQGGAAGRAGPKIVKPAARRRVVAVLMSERGMSERRACGLIRLDRTTRRYVPKPRDDQAIRSRLLELAAARPRFGYRRLTVMLRREGVLVNHKRVQRLYREEGLALRRKRRRHVSQASRAPKPMPEGANERWSMDFMQDTLMDGRCFRLLNVVDDFSREALAMDVAQSITGERVVRVLDQVVEERGKPSVIVVDNSPEFTSRALDAWAYGQGIQLHFIQPGKPVQNCFVESFNGKAREECLNEHWFIDLVDARSKIEAWREDYNEVRPHSSLGDVPPAEFARQAA